MLETLPAARKSLFVPELGRILRVEKLTARETVFEIALDQRPLGHKPCQFVEVSIAGIGEAPISVSSSPNRSATFDLCVRQAGSLTKAMHALGKGDTVGIRGPYGNGFPVEKIHGKERHVGKTPGGPPAADRAKEKHLVSLRRQLQAAVKGENYELAAKLRDELRQAEEAAGGVPDASR